MASPRSCVELPWLLREEIRCPLVLVGRSDVEPWAVEVVGHDLPIGRKQRMHEIWEIEAAVGDHRDRLGSIDVDAHADVVMEERLLHEARHALILALDHAQSELHVLAMA